MMGSSSKPDFSEKNEEGSLEERLAKFPNEKLVQEVISVWDEVVRMEQDLVNSRQRSRALELELAAVDLEHGDGPSKPEIKEQLREIKMRCGKL